MSIETTGSTHPADARILCIDKRHAALAEQARIVFKNDGINIMESQRITHVAIIADAVVGAAATDIGDSGNFGPEIREISIVVSPEFRRRGVAMSLLTRAYWRVRNRNCTPVMEAYTAEGDALMQAAMRGDLCPCTFDGLAYFGEGGFFDEDEDEDEGNAP